MDFARATHAIWWVMTACGAAVLMLGFASKMAWAGENTEHVVHLLKERSDAVPFRLTKNKSGSAGNAPVH